MTADPDPKLRQELAIGPLRFGLMAYPGAPVVTLAEPWLKPLAWFLTDVLASSAPEELMNALVARTPFEGPYSLVEPVPAGEAPHAQAPWSSLPPAELAAIEVHGERTVVPWALIREALERLRPAAREIRLDPPWLFAPRTTFGSPHPDERTALEALERMLQSGSDPAFDRLGLSTDEAFPTKLSWLARWNLPTLATLYQARVATAADPPWLFRRTPALAVPHPSERAALAGFETRASSVDRTWSGLGGAPEPASLIEERRALLRDLDDAGLLSPAGAADKQAWLAEWSLPTLAQWYVAVREAAAYLASEERRRYNPGAKDQPLLGAPVTLELFRTGLLKPPHVSRFEWASWGERLLREHVRPSSDPEGTFHYHDADGWIAGLWRSDDGRTPALLCLSLREPR